MRLPQNRALHFAGGFVLMGGWAMLANRGHGWPDALRAGLVQGVLSGCLTLVMKRMIEALARLPGAAARRAPPLACGTLSSVLLGSVHLLVGTPEILATIAVPVLVSTSYAAIYAQGLLKESHHAG